MTVLIQDQKRHAVRVLARVLADTALDCGDHRMALEALLLAYASVGTAYRCCTDGAADAAEAAAQSMRRSDLHPATPGGNALH